VQPVEPEEKRAAPMPRAVPTTPLRDAIPHAAGDGERAVLDRLPLGVVVHRGDHILYANRTLLDWLGLDSADALGEAGGLNRLFAGGPALDPNEDTSRVLAISGREGEPIPVEARLLTAPWEGETALVYVLRRAGAGLDEKLEASGLALRAAEATAREMRAVLDTATDGVIILDRQGRIHGFNRSAEALFGFDSHEVEGESFQMLFAPESHRAAADYLDGVASGGVTSLLNDGREVIGRVREGGLIPLFMTLGRIAENAEKFCAVFRDISQWKRAEEDLIESRRQAERTSSAKSDFLAKISHEIRTPLNAIIGFAEVMMDERFGAMGNERYLQYVKDIHTSGQHLISLVNDLLDLSKIEAGKVELAFGRVDLNDVARQCMSIMQPQANRERIIIRSSLAPDLPEVVADARSIRQIVLNLLSNSVKFTPPGGQVIVSTMLADTGEVYLRVRDTGVGMSDAEIATALEPFRQLSTVSRARGTGLGLPLTKALVEANRASFTIKSAVSSGTLVEIAVPSTRVLAE
jgi:PAS domain S-box-containing protein